MPYGKNSYNASPGGSKSNQTADSAQKGPGFTPVKGTRGNGAPGFGSGGNTKSGTSTSSNRGKDNY